MPKSVLINLASPDPNVRLHALDYLSTIDPKISVNHLLESMGNMGETVCAEALTIIEQQWAMEQYVMELTFSTTRSEHDELIAKKP